MTDPQRPQAGQIPGRLPGTQPGLFGKLLALILSGVLAVAALMASLATLAIVALGGLALGGWLWWKTRTLRRNLRAAGLNTRPAASATPPDSPSDSPVIEGESTRLDEPRVLRSTPGKP